MATASQVSRLLKKAGHTRSVYTASAQVRGYGSSSEGFEATQGQDGAVTVRHNSSTLLHFTNKEEKRTAKLAAYTEVLTAQGFTVEEIQPGMSTSSRALKVTK